MAVDQDLVLSLQEPLLDPEQAAALLNVRPSWIRDATRAGRLLRTTTCVGPSTTA